MAFYTRKEESPTTVPSAALLQNILIIPLSAFPTPSETRARRAAGIIVIMRLQELGTRIVRRATI